MSKINLNVRVESELRYELNRVSDYVGVSRTDLVNMAIEFFRQFGKINGVLYGDVVQKIESESGVLMSDYIQQQQEAEKLNNRIEPSEVESKYQELKHIFKEYDRLKEGVFND